MKKLILILLTLAIVGVLWAADGGQTVAQVFNHRPRINNTIWDTVVTATYDIDDTSNVTQAVTVTGTIRKVILQSPDSTDGVTWQVQILDNEDVVIFDSGEQDEDTDYAFSLSEPVTGTIDVVIGPSAATGDATLDCVVTLRGD